MLIKPKEEPRLSAEIDRLRASSSELSQISALLSDSNVPKSEGGNQISGDKVRLDLVLERLKTSEKVVPDLQLMNTFLRHFAIEGRAEEARSLLSRLSKDCTRDNQKRFFYFADGVRPVQESRELVAFAFLKAGNFQEANKIMVTCMSGITKRTRYLSLYSFIDINHSRSTGCLGTYKGCFAIR